MSVLLIQIFLYHFYQHTVIKMVYKNSCQVPRVASIHLTVLLGQLGEVFFLMVSHPSSGRLPSSLKRDLEEMAPFRATEAVA